MNWPLIIVILIGVVVLFAGVRVFLMPIRLLMRLLYNSVLGLTLLWLVNYVGNAVGIHIGLNPVTVLVAGFLGIPGVLLLLAIHFITGIR